MKGLKYKNDEELAIATLKDFNIMVGFDKAIWYEMPNEYVTIHNGHTIGMVSKEENLDIVKYISIVINNKKYEIEFIKIENQEEVKKIYLDNINKEKQKRKKWIRMMFEQQYNN